MGSTKDVEVCTRAAQELKEMVDQLLAQVTPLETQIGVLSSTIMDASIKHRARSLSLE
jgi:peptidoglycan hydrolase CwlO-like protein